jgi:hypothetical protein
MTKKNQQLSLFEIEKNKVEYSSKGTKKTKDSNNYNKKLDKFYTNDETVQKVLEFLISFLESNKIDIKNIKFLEPCAGNGSFLKGLDNNLLSNEFIAYDIEPENPKIIKQDFLKIKPKYDSNLISIGNPPFGYKGNLACSFINRCSEWGDLIVFILPIQFRRFNIQKSVSQNLKLVHTSDNLPRFSFLLEEKKHNVNCLFQVWVNKKNIKLRKLKDLRLKKALPNKHKDFELYTHNNTKNTLKFFDKEKYKWDFAVHRQGFYDYEKKITSVDKLEKHKQYLFIKFNNEIAKRIFKRIDFVKLSKTNTSVPGFSNTDIVLEYSRIKKELKE